MATRPASEPATLVVGSALLCVLTLATGLVVLRGGSLVSAIPAMGAFVVVFVELLVHAPRGKR